MQEIYPGAVTFRIIKNIFDYLTFNDLIDEERVAIICDAFLFEITLKIIQEKVKVHHKLNIKEMISQGLGINVVSIRKKLLWGANAGFVVTNSKNCS